MSNRFKESRATARAARAARVAGEGLWAVLVPVLKFAVVVAVLVSAGYAGWRAVLDSPYLRVRHVEYTETPHLSDAELRAALGLDQPTNILTLDEQAAEEILEGHAWVATATVRTQLPDRVSVQVEEREAAGVAVLDGLFLVDSLGRPITEAATDQIKGLALITGLARGDYAEDPEGTRDRVVTALALARTYNRSPLSALRPLSDVHLAAGARVELMLGKTRVALGRDGHTKKLARLMDVLAALDRRKVDAAYILFNEDGERAVVKEIPQDKEIGGSLSLRSTGVGK
jgi:cell division septal protein FtsQ